MKLFKGHATVLGRRAPKSLYNLGLATYDKGDQFDQSAAVGFIHLWGLPAQTQAQTQLLADVEGPLSIMAPKEPEEKQ
jgi:argininosuccinate synthase